MPFSQTKHGSSPHECTIAEDEWTYIFVNWIKQAVESHPAKFTCKRSAASPGNFVKGIVADLAEDDLVIADLTGQKPNVYYELGIRHALRVGTIIITQDFAAVPSDLKNYYAFEYKYSAHAHEYKKLYGAFRDKLHELLDSICGQADISDNPVSDFLGIKDQISQKLLDQEKREFTFILKALGQELTRNCQVVEGTRQAFADQKVVELRGVPVIDCYPLETLYNRIVSFPWRCMPASVISQYATAIAEIRRLFVLLDRSTERFLNHPGDVHGLAQHILSVCKEIERIKAVADEHLENVLKEVAAIHLKVSGPTYFEDSKRGQPR